MIDTVKQKIRQLLSDGSVKAVIALANANCHVAPCLFQKGDDLENLSLGDTENPGDARYPLNKVLITISRQYPEDVFGVLVRGCDERGLFTLYRLNQLEPDKVVSIGIPCPQDAAHAESARNLFLMRLWQGKKPRGFPSRACWMLKAWILPPGLISGQASFQNV